MADKARQKTDKILNDVEGAISTLYAQDTDLKKIGMKYRKYMEQVDKATEKLRKAVADTEDEDTKHKAQMALQSKIEALTIRSKTYKSITNAFCYQLAIVNQQALDMVNETMPEIFMLNYNQVAVECKRVGIEVRNGKE